MWSFWQLIFKYFFICLQLLLQLSIMCRHCLRNHVTKLNNSVLHFCVLKGTSRHDTTRFGIEINDSSSLFFRNFMASVSFKSPKTFRSFHTICSFRQKIEAQLILYWPKTENRWKIELKVGLKRSGCPMITCSKVTFIPTFIC